MTKGGQDVRFGTDGWRAVIADRFTFERVERVAGAIARYLLRQKRGRTIVIGYDTRFLSDQFAARAADAATRAGAAVLLADRFVTTPMVSLAVKKLGAAGGIVVTASHNPPAYNGLKVKGYYGGPAVGDMITRIEAVYRSLPAKEPRARGRKADLKSIDLRAIYGDHLMELIKWSAIEARGFRVAVDYMFGAGQGHLRPLLGPHVAELTDLRCHHNPGFEGVAPEPLEHKLETLKKTVVDGRLDAGFAFDGDADRIAAVDDAGRYVDSHRIFALLLDYLWNHKKIRGLVGKTFSSTSMVEKMAAAFGAKIRETPIGFKHLVEQMLKSKVFIGGEESGGIGMKHHIMERDGFFCAILLLEYMAQTGKKLSGLIDELHERYGPHHFAREDVHWEVPGGPNAALYRRLSDRLGGRLGEKAIVEQSTLDGLKVFFKGGDWLLFRFSGTEPTLRIYAEMANEPDIGVALSEARKLVLSLA
ncbi:MAG: phosphoglucomutase/phosphomannomutase family protein [Nitrospirae bacterium]|nr:phosphoglucomutase/phosphomannomutase family protein [Nitrospirota bacterium]